MAMAMLLQGTSGDTEKEIEATIFKGIPKDVVAKKFKQLTQVNLGFKVEVLYNNLGQLKATIKDKLRFKLYLIMISWKDFVN